MAEAVVITGLGAVSSLGTSVADLWQAVCEGRSGIRPLGKEAAGTRIRTGATLRNFDPQQHFPCEELPLLDRYAQFALLASQEALRDAGLQSDNAAMSNTAAIIGTGCGGKQTDEETYAQLYKDRRTRIHPLTIPKGMPGSAATSVSRNLGIKGPVFSVASACASAAHAVTQAYLMIQSGMVEVALAGGADSPFTYGLLKAWEALRVVSSDTCRPFSADRSGMVLAEGAGILVLESRQHARRRGARVYAELAGCGMSSDAGHITRPDVNGIALAISRALANADMQAEDVAYINAHGTGTPANDPTETSAIRNVFGPHADKLAVSSTKAIHGHALGASSALELIATVLAIQTGVVPPTVNFTTPGEGCDLDYVPNTARQMPVRAALCNSFAFGGLNAVIALRQVTG